MGPTAIAMPEEVARWRKARRAELLAAREAVDAGRRRAWNEAIRTRLLAAFPALARMTVGFYWPYRGEFDPRVAVLDLRRRGARAALPEVVARGEPLRFRHWQPDAPIEKGVFGLPVPQTEVVVPEALLIPPIGFDAAGYRLGYGGGYFDRTLAAAHPQPLKIAVAFELSRIPTIRPQPHDVPMDFVVTEAGVHRVTPDGLAPLPADWALP